MSRTAQLPFTHPYSQAVLGNVGRAVSLQRQEQEYFVSLLQRREYARNEHVLMIGDLCTHQSYVIEGCLKVYYCDEAGGEHTAKFALKDWWAFDIESFFQSSPAYYGISCLEDTVVLQLSVDAHGELLRNVPAFERFYRLMFQQSFIALQHRMTQSLALPAHVRYERFQKKYPGLESRISQRNVASYLGITPVFLSMLKKKYLVKH
jgi:CRP-like cAMP-binding protein